MRLGPRRTPRDAAAVVAAAALLNLAYPPFRALLPSFVCLVPLLPAFEQAGGVRRHAARGFWFGALAHAALLNWMAIALWRFRPPAVALFIVVVLGFGVYTAGLFGAVAWIRQRTRLPLIVVFPVAWTALEWMISRQGPLALPWLGLGTSLGAYPILAQPAEAVGARGLTLVVVVVNVALALAWGRRSHPRRALRLLAGVAAAVSIWLGYGWLRLTGLPLRVAGTALLVQPNLDAEQKWDPALQDSLVGATLALSRAGARGHAPDLIVWPEVALPVALAYRPDWAAALRRHAAESGAALVVGGVDLETLDGRRARTYNAAFLVGAGAPGTRPYRKERLVPAFEWFNGITPGRDNPPARTARGVLGLLICHEIAFEGLARERRRGGADVLVNLANDAWFLGTAAPAQHAAHAVLRAIETRAGVLRVDNAGPSGAVDPLGRVKGWTRVGQRTARIVPMVTSDVRTLYVRLGDWVGLACVLGLGAMMAAGWRRPLKHHLADVLPGMEVLVGRDRAVASEGEGAVHHGTQFALGDAAEDLLERRPEHRLLAVEVEQVHAQHANVGLDERQRMEPRGAEPGPRRREPVAAAPGHGPGQAVEHQPAERGQQPAAPGRGLSAHRVQRHIHSSAA